MNLQGTVLLTEEMTEKKKKKKRQFLNVYLLKITTVWHAEN